MKRKIVYCTILHLLFWLFDLWRGYFFWDVPAKVFVTDQLVAIFVFYLNYGILVPQIIRIDRAASFGLWAIVFVTVYCLFTGLWYSYEPTFFEYRSNWLQTLGYFLHYSFYYGSISTALRLGYDWAKNQEHVRELSFRKTSSQIQLLKSNFNFPFVLEVLNFLETKSKHSANDIIEPLLNISNVLRYGLYQNQEEKVFLSKELEIIREYISLSNTLNQTLPLELVSKADQNNMMTIPGLLLKVLIFWHQQVGNEFTEKATLHLEANSQEINLKLPECKVKIGLIEQHSPPIVTSWCSTTYLVQEGSIIVKLNIFKNDN